MTMFNSRLVTYLASVLAVFAFAEVAQAQNASFNWATGYPKTPPATPANTVHMLAQYTRDPNVNMTGGSWRVTNTLTGVVVQNNNCANNNGYIGLSWNTTTNTMNPVVVSNLPAGSYKLEMIVQYGYQRISQPMTVVSNTVIP